AIDRVTVHASGASAAFVHVRRSEKSETSDGSFAVDVTLADPRGELLAEISGLRLRATDAQAVVQATKASGLSNAVFRIDWPIAAQGGASRLRKGKWLVVGAEGDELSDAIASRLRAVGASCERAPFGGVLEALPAANLVAVWPEAGPDEQAADEALRL